MLDKFQVGEAGEWVEVDERTVVSVLSPLGFIPPDVHGAVWISQYGFRRKSHGYTAIHLDCLSMSNIRRAHLPG